MRSDREEIPEPFTKADADKAETMEARISISRLAVGCQVYWPSPFEVCGAIKDKYNSLGGPGSFLSFPTTAELTNPNNSGKRTQFLNGPIYWSVAGGAHPVVNSFLNRWGVHGYEAGWLAYPTTDEVLLPDGGRRQEFQNGAIYVAFQNAVGSAIKNGPIRDKWNTVGGTAPGGSLLGYLTGDEIPLPDGLGRMARFERGTIYWSPTTGAHTVVGDILNRWQDEGFEEGQLGYPTADQIVESADRVTQTFAGGSIGVSVLYRGTAQELTPTSGGGFRTCDFLTKSDDVHVSTWKDPVTGIRIPPTASVHGWWETVTCPSQVRADVAVQLETMEPNGVWVQRGSPGYANNTWTGGGSTNENRATAKSLCVHLGDKTWRARVDVDLIDWIDPNNQPIPRPPREIPCS